MQRTFSRRRRPNIKTNNSKTKVFANLSLSLIKDTHLTRVCPMQLIVHKPFNVKVAQQMQKMNHFDEIPLQFQSL